MVLFDLVIRNVRRLNEEGRVDIGVNDGAIDEIGSSLAKGKVEIDGRDQLILPGFVNAHTHVSMSLMRGFGDDLPLKDWLENKIWPTEAKLTEEDCYWGARLSLAEMIRSGTTAFCDMYWHMPGVAKAAKEMGLRALLASPLLSRFRPDLDFRRSWQSNKERLASGEWGSLVQLAIGPHAPYSVEVKDLAWVAETAKADGVAVHIHLSENEWEVNQCIEENDGKRPGELLESLGFYDVPLIAAHGVWLNEQELEQMSGKQVLIAHCPASNMKLTSGGSNAKVLPYKAIRKAGVKVAVATDGDTSNNNLDLLEEVKFASLLAKHSCGDPTVMPAEEALDLLYVAGREIFCLQNYGKITEGVAADLILIDTSDIAFQPPNDLTSHLIYSANGSAVSTTICNGKVLMRDRQIEDLETIVAKCAEIAARITT